MSIAVGAGLGGLAAAVAAHRAGHEVMVLERAPELREAGGGVAILPNGLLALDSLGVGAPLQAGAALHDGGGFALRDRHGHALLAPDPAAVVRRPAHRSRLCAGPGCTACWPAHSLQAPSGPRRRSPECGKRTCTSSWTGSQAFRRTPS